ncbi:hypothetical protein Bca52824_027141 [Brassica carinata]|uniref:Uncharacterized protein n=1 Tax=Brassica carinata TaxID=52824 RepID=A0A8X7SJB4_BRACI|nr:hypothetical protein Bca52824_027141 [Brassica carinata]
MRGEVMVTVGVVKVNGVVFRLVVERRKNMVSDHMVRSFVDSRLVVVWSGLSVMIRVVVEIIKVRVSDHMVRGFMDSRLMGGAVRILVVRNEARSGQSMMSDQICGLLHILRRGQIRCDGFDEDRIRSAFLLPRGEGIAPGIKEAALQVGRIEAAPLEPPSGRARSSRHPSGRSSFRASGSTPRVGVDIEDPQRSPISLSSNSQGDSASSSHKHPRSSGDILPESSHRSSSRDMSKKQKLVGDGSARAIGVDLVGHVVLVSLVLVQQ